MKQMEVRCIYPYEGSIMKPTKHWKREERGIGNVNMMEGLNFFKVYCTCVLNYYDEIPSYD
jgi:hypothetical protein